MYIVLALITGACVIFSMVINSRLSDHIGIFQGTFINYLTAAIVSLVIILLNQDIFSITLKALTQTPNWAFFGGIIGIAVVAISNVIIPKIPAIYSTLIIFVGQLIAGLVIDFYLGTTISIGKLIGGGFVITGLLYNFKVDFDAKQDKINKERVS
jgi:transporter family-2 protein